MEKERAHKASDERIAQSPLNKLKSNGKIQGLIYLFILSPLNTPAKRTSGTNILSKKGASGRGFYFTSCENESYLQLFEDHPQRSKDHGCCFLFSVK